MEAIRFPYAFHIERIPVNLWPPTTYSQTAGPPQDARTTTQHTVRNRSTQVRSTSSPSRFHQFSAEKISTSCGP